MLYLPQIPSHKSVIQCGLTEIIDRYCFRAILIQIILGGHNMRAILFLITILAFLFLDLPSLLMKKVKSLNRSTPSLNN